MGESRCSLFPSSVFVNKTAKDKTADLFQVSQLHNRETLSQKNSKRLQTSGVFHSLFLKPMLLREVPTPSKVIV